MWSVVGTEYHSCLDGRALQLRQKKSYSKVSLKKRRRIGRRNRERERRVWRVLGLKSVCLSSLQLGCTVHLSRDVSHHDTGEKLHLTTNVTYLNPIHKDLLCPRYWRGKTLDFKMCLWWRFLQKGPHENWIRVIYKKCSALMGGDKFQRQVEFVFFQSGSCLYSDWVAFQREICGGFKYLPWVILLCKEPQSLEHFLQYSEG